MVTPPCLCASGPQQHPVHPAGHLASTLLFPISVEVGSVLPLIEGPLWTAPQPPITLQVIFFTIIPSSPFSSRPLFSFTCPCCCAILGVHFIPVFALLSGHHPSTAHSQIHFYNPVSPTGCPTLPPALSPAAAPACGVPLILLIGLLYPPSCSCPSLSRSSSCSCYLCL